MIAALVPQVPPSTERTLDWLWAALGFGTVHRLNRDNIYLSHLLTGGLTLFEVARAGNEVTLGAMVNAPGDPAATASLRTSLDSAIGVVPGSFEELDAAGTAAALAAVDGFTPSAAMDGIFVGAGIPATSKDFTAALRQMPLELWALLKLPGALDAKIRAANAAAAQEVHALAEALETAGIVSLMPLMSATDTFLAAGADALPGAGINVGERASSIIRWSLVTISGKAGLATGAGSVNKLLFEGPGLAAVVASSYVRGLGPDPYEVRVDAGDGDLLDLAAYEQVMNALERACPIGVEINTWNLRRRHVDVDGDGTADPLPPSLARHYRRFRMPRMRGLDEPDGTDASTFVT
jgi:hypothetical protein